MHKTSRVKQTIVYIKKNFRLFMNQKDWKFIIIAAVISFLVCGVVSDGMFDTYETTKSGFFCIISAAIWIGVFNSIQGICKEHDTITSETRSGLHISSYVMSHVLFDFAVCFLQTIILLGICYAYIDFPKEGIIFPAVIEYFITLLMITWGSDIMGIMISSAAPNPNTAMTAMPFVLIMQLVMSGVLFELKGIYDKIAPVTFSKWGMAALGSIGDLNNDDLPLQLNEVFPVVVRIDSEACYAATSDNLLKSWGFIALIALCFIIISIVSLKIRNRDS